ncbi:cyclic nucleotide-binding domain-containing protein [Limnohabitans sp.]|uniref:Crp/Fnr family transcriptional regulator n=1 Tax=Limnohabitans sp. TaxID=1907725 RepID=UPI00311E62D3
MKTHNAAQPLRTLESGQTLVEAGQHGAVWRVSTGVLRLERPGQDGTMLVQLALPGDLIGVEALCTQPQAYTATALVAAKVEPLEITGELSHYATMAKGFLQQQRQTLDMVRLRSGPIQQRLAYLLTVLGKDQQGRVRVVQRDELPTLREMAQIVDSAFETVCRELNHLMPRKPKASIKLAGAATSRKQTQWVRRAGVPLALAA